MDTIRFVANIHGIASVLAILWMLITWITLVVAWGLPWLREVLGRLGVEAGASKVAAALLEHPEVCGRCAYPKAECQMCPECGLNYATGLATRTDEAARRRGLWRASLRRAMWATVAVAIFWASGYLANGVYAQVNMARWGASYPELRIYQLNLTERVLITPASASPQEKITYRLHIRAKGMADSWLPNISTRRAPPLREPSIQLWVETGPNAGVGPGPDTLRTPWAKLTTLGHQPEVERAVIKAYTDAGLVDASPDRQQQMAHAVQGVQAVLQGRQGSFGRGQTAPAWPRFTVQATGVVPPPTTPLRPLRQAAFASAAAGSAPLLLGMLLLVWVRRRARHSSRNLAGSP